MHQFSGLLEINLSAIQHNWLQLRQIYSGQDCGAVVKANAYGLGYAPVVQTLFSAGCRSFFVANLSEAMDLKKLLGEAAEVMVLQGCPSGMEETFLSHKVTPVIVSREMLDRWMAALQGRVAKYAIKINTGMNRLGLSLNDFFQWLDALGEVKSSPPPIALLSHMACADEAGHPLNDTQRERFALAVDRARSVFPKIRASLANSAALFLGEPWHFDLARPGIALYGGREGVPEHIDLRPVVTLTLPVIQTRDIKRGENVGYGATFQADRDMRIALVGGGYADGVIRALSNVAVGFFKGHKVPLVGRVSMDSCAFDVSAVSDYEQPLEGERIELLGPHCDVSMQAASAETISYELLTRLGERLDKRYVERL